MWIERARRISLPLLAGLACSAIGLLPTLRYVWHRFANVRGWEAENIARSLVAGKGFSFSGEQRWLWEQWKGDPTEHFPTAWMDPVYTFVLAALHWVFGDAAFAATYALNFLCIAVMLFCAWQLATRFAGPWAGAVAMVLLAANQAIGESIFDTINNTGFAVAVVAFGALVAVRYFERPDATRCWQLGLYAGFMILSCPALQYFLLLMPAGLVALHWRDGRLRMQRPLVAVAVAVLVMLPWSIRNFLVFDEFVPVRNGAGQIAWEGTVGVASTFAPETTKLSLATPWQATSAREAVQKMLTTPLRIEMHHFQYYAIAARPPAGYDVMNEAQRDKFYLQGAKEYVQREPLIATQLALAKLEVFVMRFGIGGLGVLLFAIAGALLLLRQPRSWPLPLLAIAYSAPFALAIPYFDRYRTPIEPVFATLAAVAFVRLVRATASGRARSAQWSARAE
jgi:hypothetical protein